MYSWLLRQSMPPAQGHEANRVGEEVAEEEQEEEEEEEQEQEQEMATTAVWRLDTLAHDTLLAISRALERDDDALALAGACRATRDAMRQADELQRTILFVLSVE